MEIMKTTLNRN